jgi:putative membrane protein
MWSWWDCMQWWNSAGDGTVPWPMFLPMMLWPIVVIGGIIAFAVLLMRGGRTEPSSDRRYGVGRQTPFDVLRERFARGEIDRREYEERKGLLSLP